MEGNSWTTLAPSCSFLTLAKSASNVFNLDFICIPLMGTPVSSESVVDVVGEVAAVESNTGTSVADLVSLGGYVNN